MTAGSADELCRREPMQPFLNVILDNAWLGCSGYSCQSSARPVISEQRGETCAHEEDLPWQWLAFSLMGHRCQVTVAKEIGCCKGVRVSAG